jgi:hypothetical protein
MKAKVYKAVLNILTVGDITEEEVRYKIDCTRKLYPSIMSLETITEIGGFSAKMTFYRVVLSIVDFDGMREEAVRYELDRIPDLYPTIMSLESREIEEWDDDHPLNKPETYQVEFERLFNNTDGNG